jgi:hypothetical protein
MLGLGPRCLRLGSDRRCQGYRLQRSRGPVLSGSRANLYSTGLKGGATRRTLCAETHEEVYLKPGRTKRLLSQFACEI